MQRIKTPRDAKRPEVKINENVDCIWNREVEKVGKDGVDVEWNDSEDPLFILYTS